MIELHYAPPSIYGRKVLAVLIEKDLDYTIKPMTFAEKDHLKPEYLAMNPNGEVPTLTDDGEVIYESTAIIEYLDEEYPQPPLMPQDSISRAKVRMIDDFCDLHLNRAIVKILIKTRKKEEITAEDLQALDGDLGRIETYLGNQEFLVGKFSLADCAFMPAIPSVEKLGYGKYLDRSPAFKRYVERLKARPGYKGAEMITLETSKA